MAAFNQSILSPLLCEVLKEIGFDEFTPIQAQSIPILLEGRDLIGQSKTGSGKTAAFSLPILEKINIKDRNPQALILCPTRELCTQVAREIRKFSRRHAGLQVLTISGGQPSGPQLGALEKGAHIIVGTPGRVNDFIGRGKLYLKKMTTLVLDEADRMLDMGFQDEVEAILKAAPENRQTVFFSATFPASIEDMSRRYQKNPVTVAIENTEEKEPEIEQVIYEVNNDKKFDALKTVLIHHGPQSGIIFCNLKATVSELKKLLTQEYLSVAAIHGDLEQWERELVMTKFRNRSTRLLVATDVAARGIDIADLDLVVNYDLPFEPEVYIHRVGRTGRAGKKGLAISFMTSREKFRVEEIEKLTGKSIRKDHVSTLELADDAFLDSEEKSVEKSVEKKLLITDAAMETLRLSAGRKEKMRPGDILGALTGDAGKIPGEKVGKIEIHDHFSYVAVSKDVAEIALERLNQGQIKGRKILVILVK